MKQLHIRILGALLMLLTISCDPQEDPKPGIGSTPTAADVKFTYTYDASNPNIVNFTSTSDGFKALWDFGNGATAEGEKVTGRFPIKGDYTVKLTIFTKAGSAAAEQIVKIEQTNPIMLNVPEYNFLTGGADQLEGKTWVVDRTNKGHLGVGPSSSQSPDWYAAAPDDKAGKGLYDDEMTFKLSGFGFSYTPNENVYVNGGAASAFPGAVKENDGADYLAPYTPPTNMTWSLAEVSTGKWQLTINGGFLGYYTGVSTYEILSINENEMYVRFGQADNAGNAWYQKFIRKGYERPVNPPPYKIENIQDNFDGNSTATFVDDGGAVLTEGYDNPAPVGLNTSAKVARYVKGNGDGAAFSNVQVRLAYKMDIRNRNVFKLKVFVPSYNDYTTEGAYEWQSYKTLQKMVSVKLQNRDLGGNAYTTQAEVKQTVSVMNEWVELTFDFSAFSARTDFDQVVIQIGGEANFTGGTFFIDDFSLLQP